MALTTVRPQGMGFVTGRKNLIINGAMQVAQRGTSATVSDQSNVRVARLIDGVQISTMVLAEQYPFHKVRMLLVALQTRGSSMLNYRH